MISDKKNKYDELITKVDPNLLKMWEEEQNLLKNKLIEYDDFEFNYDEDTKNLKRIGGLDISASKLDPDLAVVALVVCDAENFKILYQKYEFVKITQPYVPGFLAFREVEHLVKLIQDLKNSQRDILPQIILTDGNGILHSNRFGLACHLGVLTGIPTIGCGKTVFNVDGIKKLTVKSEAKSLNKVGDFIYLQGTSGAIWGAALKCTEKSIDPIIVNIGHKTSLDTAINIVKNSCIFRVPEPVRIADLTSRLIIRNYEKNKNIFNIDEYLKNIKIDFTNDY
jgi:deoxyinosine 3'endonuclease (endonuclease V)